MLILIVKGTSLDAQRASECRGIPYVLHGIFKWDIEPPIAMYCLLVSKKYWNQVARWQEEEEQAPYPVGTLLYFGSYFPEIHGNAYIR